MTRIASTRPRRSARSGVRRRRVGHLLVLTLTCLGLPLAGTALAPAAVASFTSRGPIDPTTHFPAYYTDANGLSLQPCLDGPPLCLTTAADLLGTSDGSGEGFYYSVRADAGPLSLRLVLEAAYFGAGSDQEMVFSRSNFSARTGGLVPNATYTVTDPHGQQICTANGVGAIPLNGCRFQVGGTGPLDFDTALGGRVGPFLAWDTLGAPTGGPPPGTIGDGVTPHAVTGSPTGFNLFRVEGPGIASTCLDGVTEIANCAQTDQFVVSGKFAPGPAATLSGTAWDFGNRSGAATKRFTYTSVGTTDAVVTSVSTSGAAFSQANNCGTLIPGSSCTIDVTFDPVAGQESSGSVSITDNTSGSPRTIDLAGRSLPVVSSAPASLAFGERGVTAGPTSQQTVTVTNSGAAPMAVAATSDGSAFAVDDTACASVAAGSHCAVKVAFDPGVPGAVSATVAITTDAGDRSVAVSGTGVQSGISSSSGVAFGEVGIGSVAHRTLTVTNNGTAPLVLEDPVLSGSGAASYDTGDATSDLCVPGASIAIGDSCELGVAFRPTAVGSAPATLTLASGDGVTRAVTLLGSGRDVTAPTVTSRSPAAGASRVWKGTNVVVGFSEPVQGVGARSFVLTNQSSGRVVSATFSSTSTQRYVLNPRVSLPVGTLLRVSLLGGSTRIRDLNGVALATTSWRFRTR